MRACIRAADGAGPRWRARRSGSRPRCCTTRHTFRQVKGGKFGEKCKIKCLNYTKSILKAIKRLQTWNCNLSQCGATLRWFLIHSCKLCCRILQQFRQPECRSPGQGPRMAHNCSCRATDLLRVGARNDQQLHMMNSRISGEVWGFFKQH